VCVCLCVYVLCLVVATVADVARININVNRFRLLLCPDLQSAPIFSLNLDLEFLPSASFCHLPHSNLQCSSVCLPFLVLWHLNHCYLVPLVAPPLCCWCFALQLCWQFGSCATKQITAKAKEMPPPLGAYHLLLRAVYWKTFSAWLMGPVRPTGVLASPHSPHLPLSLWHLKHCYFDQQLG